MSKNQNESNVNLLKFAVWYENALLPAFNVKNGYFQSQGFYVKPNNIGEKKYDVDYRIEDAEGNLMYMMEVKASLPWGDKNSNAVFYYCNGKKTGLNLMYDYIKQGVPVLYAFFETHSMKLGVMARQDAIESMLNPNDFSQCVYSNRMNLDTGKPTDASIEDLAKDNHYFKTLRMDYDVFNVIMDVSDFIHIPDKNYFI